MFRLPRSARRILALTIFGVLLAGFQGASAQAPPAPSPAPQDAPPPSAPVQTDSAPTAPQAPASAPQSEVATRDNPATFRVKVNLVLARVVVRDADGKVVTNLKKEDFLLFDNRKPQVISSFSLETPGMHVAAPPVAEGASSDPGAPVTPGTPPVALPQRFVAMVFDDGHLEQSDAVFVRAEAMKFFDALAPSDRVGIYTTSGQITQEFTNDHELLKKALLGIIPRPVLGGQSNACPDISYYQADLIVNKSDTQALAVATQDAISCAFSGDQRQAVPAQSLAQSQANLAVNAGDTQTEYAYRHMEDIMRRLAGMPGQRVMVLVSPGFITTNSTQSETYDIIERALRSGIVVNTIDARGLYTPDVLGDIANPPHGPLVTVGIESSYRIAAQFANEDVLAQLADGTGGTFFHNRNDVGQGMREAGAAPALAYVLGFSPQNLKVDGRYHTLDVKLANKLKFKLQARRGYFAPKSVSNPEEEAKQEVMAALYSQDEITDLPAELHTQYFKKDSDTARLAVLTRLDLKGLRFRKAEGRNRNDVTVATAIFDENGNFVTGGEKIVEMRLLDATYDKLSHSGITVRSSFDVKPGTYLVRQVVRDSEGAQMAARNGSVVIPY